MAVAATNTLAWIAIAMAGTTAYHHCLVRHQIRATAITQTPMTISVLPRCDHTIVTEFISSGRPDATDLLRSFSAGRPPSGPMMRKPTPTIAAKSTSAGDSARTAKSRRADPTEGRD